MKKILCLTLAVLVLSSCSVFDKREQITPTQQPKTDSATEAAPKQTEITSETIEPTVLVDENGLTVTALSLALEASSGIGIDLSIVNNTSTDLLVQARDLSVNGYMIGAVMSANAPAGETTESRLIFRTEDLTACGIEHLARMEFKIGAFDSATFDPFYESERIELLSSIAEGYEYTYDDSGEALYESDSFRIISKGLAAQRLNGPELLIYVENLTDQDIIVQARDVLVNAMEAESTLYYSIDAGKRGVCGMGFVSEALDSDESPVVESVDFSLHIIRSEDLEPVLDTDKFSLTF